MEQAAITFTFTFTFTFIGSTLDIPADPRIGGLDPHQTKKIRGKLYIIPNDIDELLRRYHRDFETKLGD